MTTDRPQRSRRVRLAGILAIAVVIGGGGTLVWLQPTPPGDFYAGPDDLADHEPGDLLAAEPFERGLPGRVDGWRVLYVSTDADGEPVAVSGLVLTPTDARDDPRPLVAIAHGSTGIDEACAPSLSPRPLASLPGAQAALDAGYVVSATDYPGLGTPGPHPYMIGSASAHAVLDAARSADELVDVDTDQVAIWGFSQGGHATLFAGEQAPSYAPELGIRGLVAFAPAADLARIIEESQGTVLGTLITVNAAVAWSDARDELDLEQVIAADSVDTARDITDRCLDPTSLPASVAQSLQLIDDVAPLDTPGTEDWAAFLEANTPSGHLDVPLLLLQGADDPVIRPEATEAYAAERCADGVTVDLRVIPNVGHFTLGRRSAGQALAWTQQRFDGEPARSTC